MSGKEPSLMASLMDLIEDAEKMAWAAKQGAKYGKKFHDTDAHITMNIHGLVGVVQTSPNSSTTVVMDDKGMTVTTDTKPPSTLPSPLPSPKPEVVRDRLVFVDLETTGFDPDNDGILELACVITDLDLNELAVHTDHGSRGDLKLFNHRMNDYVRKMHTDSGLLAAIEACEDRREGSGAEAFIDFLRTNVPEKGRGLLAGSTISFDKSFLRVWTPEILDHLHYRSVDVSTIKELVRAWCPALSLPKQEGKHRALDDIRWSIKELSYYKSCFALMANVAVNGSNQAAAAVIESVTDVHTRLVDEHRDNAKTMNTLISHLRENIAHLTEQNTVLTHQKAELLDQIVKMAR